MSQVSSNISDHVILYPEAVLCVNIWETNSTPYLQDDLEINLDKHKNGQPKAFMLYQELQTSVSQSLIIFNMPFFSL